MSAPLVSVVVPFFNRSRYLADAIESVLAQDYTNWQLVLVDDGSTDGSREVAERYADGSRIRLMALGRNRGPSAARNIGAEHSSGELICFLDSDDIFTPRALSSRVYPLLENGADVAFSSAVVIVASHGRRAAAPSGVGPEPRLWTADALLERMVAGSFSLAACNWLTWRETFLHSGGFDEELRTHEDVEFLTRFVFTASSWIETFEAFYVWRRTPGSVCSIDSTDKAIWVLATFAKIRHNLAPWFERHPERVAEALFARCIQCWPYWTDEHRAAMREAFELADGHEIDLTRFVGGPKAQAIARLFGWRAGKLATFVSDRVRTKVREFRARA